MGGKKSFGQNQAAVLKVALAPTPVADKFIHQRGGAFLVRAAQFISQPYPVPRPAHERRLHKVVAEYFTAQRALAGQAGQLAMLHKGLDPDDGVMAPVLGVAQLPVVQPRREDGTV